MYAGGLLYFLGMPVALGSWWGFFVALLTTAPLIWRIFEEEKFLCEKLPGYQDYRDKVKYRLAPFSGRAFQRTAKCGRIHALVELKPRVVAAT